MAFGLQRSARARSHGVVARVKRLKTICAAVTIGAAMTGCGGGSTPSTDPSSAGSQDGGGRLSAQSIPVSTAAVTGIGWIATPPEFAEPTSYTRSSNTGRTFYVDQSAGSDSNNGTTEQTPWKTLSRVGQEVFANGDAILLRCGRVWRESLSLSGNNRPDYKNLLIGAYGDDCTNDNRPVIRASKWVTDQGWVAAEPGSAVNKLSVTGPVMRLFQHGQPLMQARYPNPQSNGNRFASADVTGNLTGSETDAEKAAKKKLGFKVRATELSQLQGKVLAGATVYVRTLPYIVETAKVDSFNPTTGEVTLQQALRFPVEKSAGYIFEGKLWMVDSDGEWFHDSGTNHLYLQGNNTGLEATQREQGLHAYMVAGLKIERVRLEQQESDALTADQVTNLVINDVESVHSYGHGIVALSSPGASITQSRVDGAGKYGIVAINSADATITHNYVTRNGLFRVGAPQGDAASRSIGIRTQNSAGAHVEHNYIYNSSSNGIQFDNLAGVVVAYNTVLQPCQLLTDCGGIYTFGGENFSAASAIRGNVHHNIVAGLKSNLDGSHVYGTNNSVAGKNQAVAIYLDDHSSWVAVTDNHLVGTEVGVYINHGGNNLIQSNTVRAATYTSLLATFLPDKVESDQMQGNEVLDNTFLSLRRVDTGRFSDASITNINGELTYAQVWIHQDDPRAFFANNGGGPRNRSERNHTYTLSKIESPSVWRRVDSGKLEQVSGTVWGLKGLNTQWETLGLSQWIELTQPAANAKDKESNPVAFKAFRFTPSSSLISNGDFIDGQGGWVSNGGGFVYTSGAACGGAATCARVQAVALSNILASSTFSVTDQNLYRARYTVAAGAAGGGHNAQIRQNGNPSWSTVALSVPTSTWAANEVRRIEHFFKATTTASDVVLSLRPTDNVSVTGEMFFSQASLSPVTVEAQALPTLGSLGVTVVNASDTSKSFGCVPLGFSSADCTNGRVVDELGQLMPFPFQVPARSVKQLYVRLVDWAE